MFYKHLIIDNDKDKSLYLFIDFNYEFGMDFHLKGKKEKIKTLYDNVISYIKDKKIDFTTGKVLIVVGGLVIGSLFIQGYKYSELKDQLDPQFKYVDHIAIFESDTSKDNIFVPPVTNTPKENQSVINQSTSILQPKIDTHTPIVSTPPPAVTAPTPVIPSTPPTPPQIATHPTPSTPVISPTPEPIEASGPFVTLYRYNGTVEKLNLEDYVVGVVSSEMPASFSTEALKAQSILARTYALKKISQNQVLKDDTSSQVYKDIGQLKTLWGSSFDTYYSKVKNAVSTTKDESLTYNGGYIEAVYHSTSNGQTENSVAVWGNNYPYLKSVDSHWDLDASSYLRETTKEFNVLSSIIGVDFNADTNIEVLSRTEGNRINQIKIGDTVFSGTELRSLLGLRSADFDIKIGDGIATIVTRGYGHGVGMSQYGANGMAKEGYNYKDILLHYYPGTQIKN